jgi:hypothetical protein
MTEVLRTADGVEVRQPEHQGAWTHPRGARCTPTTATVTAAQRGPVVYALLHAVDD